MIQGSDDLLPPFTFLPNQLPVRFGNNLRLAFVTSTLVKSLKSCYVKDIPALSSINIDAKNTKKTRDKELLLWFYRARVNIGNCDHFYKNCSISIFSLVSTASISRGPQVWWKEEVFLLNQAKRTSQTKTNKKESDRNSTMAGLVRIDSWRAPEKKVRR